MAVSAYPSSAAGRNSISARVIAVAAAVALLYFGRGFLITMVVALILTFILDPSVGFLVRFRLPRPLASLIVCLLSAGMLVLVGAGIYNQVAGLGEDLPAYAERIRTVIGAASTRMEQFEADTTKALLPKQLQDNAGAQDAGRKQRRRGAAEPPAAPQIQEVRVRPEPTPLFARAYAYLSSFYDVFVMASFVPFLVYFMLSWKEHIRRQFLQLFTYQDGENTVGRAWSSVGDVARAYVVGNFLLGLLLAIISALFFWLLRLPYWLVIGSASGFLSLVPYVGLPLALVPPFLAAMIIYDGLTPYVMILTVVGLLHLLALNVLYPKMVGSRVHLNPLAVTVALMFWGTLWGGIGLVLAIPITAAAKAICDNVASLQPYGRLLGD